MKVQAAGLYQPRRTLFRLLPAVVHHALRLLRERDDRAVSSVEDFHGSLLVN